MVIWNKWKNCTGQGFFMFLTLSVQLYQEFSIVVPISFGNGRPFLQKGRGNGGIWYCWFATNLTKFLVFRRLYIRKGNMMQQRRLTHFPKTVLGFSCCCCFNCWKPGLTLFGVSSLRISSSWIYAFFFFFSHSVEVKISIFIFQLQKKNHLISLLWLCCPGRQCHQHGDPFLQGKGTALQSS